MIYPLRLLGVAAVSVLVWTASASAAGDYRDASWPIDRRVEDLLSRMTVEEKVGQLQQQLFDVGMEKNMDPFLEAIRRGQISSYILMLEDAKYRNAMQKAAVEQSRLGIPLLFGADIIHGQRTVFPIPLGLACAWDPALFEKIQTVAAREGRAMGLNWTFAPMCDLARDARWGRTAETGGEDPYLNSLYAAAAVHGFQGKKPSEPGRLVATLKHFAGYSATEGGRDYNTTPIPPFALRNLYLPSFHAGVEAGALTVMSSFNAIDGVPSAANHFLLTDILRGEWSFDGFVVGDWENVKETVDWGYAADDAAAARLCLTAGNDMEMLSKTFQTLPAQVGAKSLPPEVLDQAVRRVLRVKFQSGIFEQPYVDEHLYASTILAPESVALARLAVARSSVLLKNNGILPLAPGTKRIALIGPFIDDGREMLGCWIGQGKAADVVTIAAAMKGRLPADTQLQVVTGCDSNGSQPRMKALTDGTIVEDKSAPPPVGLFDLAGAVKAANESDVVIMALGEPWYWTGENASRARLGLTGRQQELYDAVAAVGKPVVVILICARPLTVPRIFDSAAAVLVAWQPGVQAGPGLVDLLTGAASPTGRLTISWPRDSGQLPFYYNHENTGRPADVFVHYRDMTRDPQFPFGFGLSYTKFDFGPAEIVKGASGQRVFAKATITNTGDRPGETVAQLYIRQLACLESVRPAQELRGFEHVSLKPGENREVSFALDDKALGYVSRGGQWKVDPGDYQIWIAPQSGAGEPVRYTRP